MRYRTPHLGPLAGQLCRVEGDQLTPVPPAAVPSAQVGPAVLLPLDGSAVCSSGAGGSSFGGERDGKTGSTRETIARFTAQLRANGFTRAEGIARESALSWDRAQRR